jgi:CTP synthase
MQCAIIEFARDVLNLAGANSTEFDLETPHPVICLLDAQREVTTKGGTMRLGSYPCVMQSDTFARAAYGSDIVHERHRHRYELNNRYRQNFIEHDLIPVGLSPDGKLVEIVELRGHPWFVAVQYHPEFKSKPTAAQPLFREFVRAALAKKKGGRYQVSIPRSTARGSDPGLNGGRIGSRSHDEVGVGSNGPHGH